MTGKLTTRNIHNILSNPVYTGIGQYEAILPDDEWIDAVLVTISQGGSHFWLDVETNAIQFLGLSEKTVSDICLKAKNQCDRTTDNEERRQALKTMLTDLRIACQG